MVSIVGSRKLQVDFSWKKFEGLITDANDPSNHPLYIVHWNAIKSPHITFKRPSDDHIVGTGTLHLVRINADFEVHGRSRTLVAQKRFKTLYTHETHAYADPGDREAGYLDLDKRFRVHIMGLRLRGRAPAACCQVLGEDLGDQEDWQYNQKFLRGFANKTYLGFDYPHQQAAEASYGSLKLGFEV
ncbi:predicted protein [Aspergillus nidulans FGSC A4]|uniref:Uncharacterized protein n=1 Tax=Emericella nidulans (strain FGSC A4 / ATCC 38163 / CBS 112.46 / NRRL 194 / M139) TaxID=227321 RepID=Q5AXM3_EMENI|nr:hypothetical protein [Aspergillus nidulans FGSC A4]EAA57712.1 predicted protein [Aspergillus nidulans FGSC A4]CBF71821.1 TPA: conserved hypothetical protein [Aspergillus nidulans FGSC A4]|eukprot:XP_664561.1 predicted protein [Aspergillus nidulans FGSC A4]